MLKLYNTLTRNKQIFQPIKPPEVRMYVCGMTIYDLCHLGHARMLIVFDILFRWLRALDYHVTYVRNITDIDDKIIKRAAENKESITSLTDRYTKAMHDDCSALYILPPNFEPRATQYVPEMQYIISRLIENGLAYVAEDGDVCYAVRKFADYGKLSGKSLDELRAGERVNVDLSKRDPLDFVLWKKAKANEPEEAKWDSPWGLGRPGWHIECSAMSSKILGEHFDIHGGGQDLQFPHHENEIAQSVGAHQHPFVNYWVHNGFVRVDDEKMSKSLGNFFTIRDILKHYDGEVIRFFVLRAHYRSPLNYADSHLDSSRQSLQRLYTALKAYPQLSKGELKPDSEHHLVKKFYQAMNDDLNTPEAIAVLFDLASIANRGGDEGEKAAINLKSLANILGLLERDSETFLHTLSSNSFDSSQIETLIDERIAAKKAKDFERADKIRNQLSAAGIILEDGPNGTAWRQS